MHISTIALLGTVMVFAAFLICAAIGVSHLAPWRHYEHCFAPPSDSKSIFSERERHKRRGGRFLALALVMWVSTFLIIPFQGQMAGLITACGMISLSALPFCYAMTAFRKWDGLDEAELRQYRALEDMANHRLAGVYLRAIRDSGRGWVTRIECERLKHLVQEDELRVTRQHCLSSQPQNPKDKSDDPS